MIKQRAEALTRITMMALQLDLFPLLCVLSLFVTSFVKVTHSKAISSVHDASFLNRSSFPPGFVFGAASSAYQYEGAAREGGRGPSIWDTFTHKYPQKIKDGSNGDVADDSYHRYKEDIGIMKYMDLDAYRFSISWSRILPKGKLSAGVNHEGINYYNNLISELMANGGDSGTEPYLTSHYQLLAHAAAAKLYKTKYQASQKGLIGITLNSDWYVPVSKQKSDRDAARRGLDFIFGWSMRPLTKGEYPKSMRSMLGNRLPKFTIEESRQLKGSFDFLGLNYYSSFYAAHAPHQLVVRPSLQTDSLVNVTNQHNGKLLGPMAASNWLCIYPRGFRRLLLFIKKHYNNPVIYITENGYDEFDDPTLSLEESLLDTYRVDYIYRHLYYLQTAIKDGVNVKGYFVWSLLDNMEWDSGYSVRFGLVFVDFKDGLKRYPKYSAHWFKNFLSKS
ncbi:beta-glucosidase 12 isoform X3 [Vigna radiata var. radiata]|uniref:Beta-glucosidase 12 isoform X3 n=1 Tax=Vigna radiata var. radiata TaxID=3916 RepID=A0A3Q0EUI7_VIGRR|nr:beta-glucosidase 12 isoform X3 [Vigna radiata var. radiata]